MKKQILSTLLAVTLTVSLFTVPALADEAGYAIDEAADTETWDDPETPDTADEAAALWGEAAETEDLMADPADEAASYEAEPDEEALTEEEISQPLNEAGGSIANATVSGIKSSYYVEMSLPSEKVVIDGKSYAGLKSFKPTPVLKLDGKTLKEGTDFSTTVNSMEDTLRIYTFSGMGAYDGALTFPCRFDGLLTLAGKNRWETAALIADEAVYYPYTVVIVYGKDFPDALAASGLAGMFDAPILLTDRESVPQATINYLTKNKDSIEQVIFVGGKMETPQKKVKQLLPEAAVEVIAGKNRYATAEEVCKYMLNRIPEMTEYFCVVTTGQTPADALSVSPWTFHGEAPVLLAKDGKISASTQALVDQFQTVIVLGSQVKVTVPSGTQKITLAGKNRYETSKKIAEYFLSYTHATTMPYGTTILARGEDAYFPDALAAGSICYEMPAPVLLVNDKHTDIPASIKSFMSAGGTKRYKPYYFVGSAGKGKGPKGSEGKLYNALVKTIKS